MYDETKTKIRWFSFIAIIFLLVVGVIVGSWHPYEIIFSTNMDNNTLKSMEYATDASKENSFWYKEYTRCEAYLSVHNITMPDE